MKYNVTRLTFDRIICMHELSTLTKSHSTSASKLEMPKYDTKIARFAELEI
jgi:ribosomal protein L33